ncbi:MAG: beta-ketoacyl-ACP synthase II [Spirochaetales bacterium]|nr:beta-ketoacyl-ACP synthase II [Spirochaetales bacterium]
MKEKIVVTGMGTVNPLGHSVQETWQGILEGRSGIGKITRFDTTEYASKIAGEVKDFEIGNFIDKKEARKMALFTQYGVAASVQAMNDAGIKEGDVDPERLAVVYGNGIGGFEALEEAYEKLFSGGPKRVHPMTIPKLITNECPANIAITLQALGPAYTVTTACASGTDAIGNALMLLHSGLADMVITGGTESSITRMGVAGFNVIQALSTRFNDEPERACRPFDKDRDGFILAEGAGTLILETESHAKKRGAKIYAELAGYGSTCDANHLTAPHPEGLGAARAMRIALSDAGMKPEEIDYINAHGTSTPTNDPLETKSIKTAFGDHARKVKISSTKSMHGHVIGGTGAVEAIISILAMREGYFPPTINLEEPDPACDLDYVPNKGIKGTINAVMSNSLGFGGHNAILIFRKAN